MTERLTTLVAVKEWLGIDNTNSDDQLTRLIDAVSQFVLNWLNRDSFAGQDYTQNFMGNGKNTTLLRNWPVLSISSVGIAGSLISPSTLGQGGMPSAGYRVSDPRNSPQSIDLYCFYFQYQSPCQIIYRAGFETTQTFTIQQTGDSPDFVVVPITPDYKGQWTGNIKVTEGSTVYTQVDTNDPLPSTGEYYIDEWGTYTFSLDDVGKTVVIEYSYVPPDVSFAATEIIGEWYKRKDRIGLLSKTLGGQETMTFSKKDLSDIARSSLQPYANVVPV